MQTSKSEEQKAAPIGASELEEMVTQYHHHLLCLEADLKDRSRSGAMRPREFSVRMERIRSVQKELDQLRKFAVAETPGPIVDNDIGLPVLDNCTPAERETCERGMLEKEVELLRIERDVTKAQVWLRDAVTGKSGNLLLTFRLSGLRRLIHTYSKLLTHAESEQTLIDRNTSELAKLLKYKKSESTVKNTLQTLMDLFSDLEKTISRVARLRLSLRQETAKVSEMNAWLEREELRFQEGLIPRRPPTPLALARSSLGALISGSSLSRKEVERRKVLEQFWNDIIKARRSELPNVTQVAMPAFSNQPSLSSPHPSRKVRRKKVGKGGTG